MNFRDALYETYVTNHIAQRKGVLDARALRIQSKIFDNHFGPLLPRRAKRAVDLGCGPGALVSWLQKRDIASVRGIDLSAEQVENARQIGIENVEQGDLFEFLERGGEFDVIFARDVIEHFKRQEVFDFLLAAHRSLANGGRLILQVPNAQSPYFGRVRYGDLTHELAFTGSSMRQILNAVGFSKVTILPWRPVGYDAKSRIRAVLWRLLEPLLKAPIVIESGTRDPIVTMNLIAVAEK